MKSGLKKIAAKTIVFLALGAAASITYAASGGSFSIDWSALFAGQRSQQSIYALESAIGQSATSYSQSGIYSVQSGYLAEVSADQADVGKQWLQYR